MGRSEFAPPSRAPGADQTEGTMHRKFWFLVAAAVAVFALTGYLPR